MRKPVLFIALCVIAFAPAFGQASIILPGPPLDGTTINWENSGLRFSANRDITLLSFTFHNQGGADLIRLVGRFGAVIDEIAVPAGNPEFVVTPEWDFTPGIAYDLLSVEAYNGKWADYRTYPLANDDVTIEKAIGRGDETNIYWFSFGDFQTEGLTPEPAGPMALLSVAMGMLLRRCRKAEAR